MHDGQRRPEIVTAWLAWLRLGGPSSRTIGEYGRNVTRLNDWLVAEYGIELLDATQGHLIAWRQTLTICDNSVGTYMSAVRGFYSWARKQHVIPNDPAEEIPVPRRRKGIPRPVDEVDALRAIELAPRRVWPWLVGARYQGLRCKSIAYLRREDILDTRQQLALSPQGSKGGIPKLFPLSSEFWRVLQEYGLPKRGYIFKRCDGRPGPNTPAQISHLTGNYLRSIGIDATIHQFRHSFATIALEETGNLLAVRDILGHDSVTSTEVYTKLLNEDAAAAVKAAQPKRRLRVVRDES
ncbi:MAG: tyrosine-type recombinase/integrase [Solirubrobacteraceae bacterium]